MKHSDIIYKTNLKWEYVDLKQAILMLREVGHESENFEKVALRFTFDDDNCLVMQFILNYKKIRTIIEEQFISEIFNSSCDINFDKLGHYTCYSINFYDNQKFIGKYVGVSQQTEPKKEYPRINTPGEQLAIRLVEHFIHCLLKYRKNSISNSLNFLNKKLKEVKIICKVEGTYNNSESMMAHEMVLSNSIDVINNGGGLIPTKGNNENNVYKGYIDNETIIKGVRGTLF